MQEGTIKSGGLMHLDLVDAQQQAETESKKDEFPELKGFLQKKSRQEKWQRRWFEATGHYLTYYKNQETDKLLACIDLWKTGEIKLVETQVQLPDSTANFSIAIGGQFYMIKAESTEDAERWVQGLRLRQKNPLLETPAPKSEPIRVVVKEEAVVVQPPPASAPSRLSEEKPKPLPPPPPPPVLDIKVEAISPAVDPAVAKRSVLKQKDEEEEKKSEDSNTFACCGECNLM